MPVYKFFINRLKAINTFLGDLSIRRLFVATCLAGMPGQAISFKAYSTVRIDWRWESLSICLERLLPLLSIMKENLGVDRMMRSDDGKTDATVIRDARKSLDVDKFTEFAHFVYNQGKNIDFFSASLGGMPLPRECVDWKG